MTAIYLVVWCEYKDVARILLGPCKQAPLDQDIESQLNAMIQSPPR